MSKAVVWFRNDLRLYDHEALHKALAAHEEVICVYVFDPFWWSKDSFGMLKTGSFRTQFLLESVSALRSKLQAIGTDLIVRVGDTATKLQEIYEVWPFEHVYFHYGFAVEETSVELAIQKALPNVTRHGFDGATLFHWEDLPFESIAQFSNGFTSFRKKVEKKQIQVRELYPKPEQITSIPEELEKGELPAISGLAENLTVEEPDERAAIQFPGGEQAGIDRLNHYFWETKKLGFYKKTRNGLTGADYSSKFSAWLALGCLSPRYIYWQVKAFEEQQVKNESTYWLVFELMWRDFFHFVGRKYGASIFKPKGIKDEVHVVGKRDMNRFELWRKGETGIPFVDANMKELLHTGFMSNRGRQNVASFLVKDMQIDWRLGASWFGHQLIDYDVFANWGNWNYVAGVGTDPRQDRWFNIIWQSKKYDSKGKYIKHWLPELGGLSSDEVHQPYLVNVERATLLNIPEHYYHPIFTNPRWLKHTNQ